MDRGVEQIDFKKQLAKFPSGAGSESEGVARLGPFEFEGNLFLYPIYALILGIFLWLILMILLRMGMIKSVLIGFSPLFLTTSYVLLLINRRPPGFRQDLRKLFWQGAEYVIYPEFQPRHPLK